MSFVQDNKDSLRYEEKVQGKTPLNSSTRATSRDYLTMSQSVWESICMHPLSDLALKLGRETLPSAGPPH